MELREWYMPVTADPSAVRPREIGETRPIEPSEMTYWGRLLPIFRLGRLMAWPNQTYIKMEHARHVTSLSWPG